VTFWISSRKLLKAGEILLKSYEIFLESSRNPSKSTSGLAEWSRNHFVSRRNPAKSIWVPAEILGNLFESWKNPEKSG